MSSAKPTWCEASGKSIPLSATWMGDLGGMLGCCPACGCDVPVMLDGTPARVLDHRAVAEDMEEPCPE